MLLRVRLLYGSLTAQNLRQYQGCQMSELDTFRSESREWLDENCPREMRDLSFHWEEAHEIYRLPKAKVWLERMAEKG